MSHGIEKPIDKVFSTEGTEWHGLADAVETITKETVRPILPRILTGKVVVDVEGQAVPMGNHKALIADYRECNPDLISDESTSGGLVPLHIPKNGYQPIENVAVWDAMETAIADVEGVKISSCGTIEAGKIFFISVTLADGGKFQVNGDEYLANLNFLTSHNGVYAMEAFDSMIRQICRNTVRWSREAAGEVGFKAYHTLNADFAMKNIGGLINQILTGRAKFKDSMQYLASVSVSVDDAKALVTGYFAQIQNKKELATRSLNTIEAITELFQRGTGNQGKTLYDLLNGFTEYYSGGDGTGKDASKTEKMCKANFGMAANHKDAVMNLLLAGDDRRLQVIESGREAMKASV